MNSEDEFDFDKFTAIAVDPPGLGKSRPPQRKYGKDYYNIDIEAYHAVIQVTLNCPILVLITSNK